MLIVEDNPVNAAVFEGLLNELGRTHVAVASGREAVALTRAEGFAAVLMDIHMPDMDGWTATAQIRQTETGRRHTPILALTADASESQRIRCRDAGMDDFLTKPLALETLRTALSRWLPAAAPAPERSPALTGDTLSQIEQIERSGRSGLLSRVAALFADSSALQVEKIVAAAADQDLPTVSAQCHSLKSAAGHVGANQLAQLAIELERASNLHDVDRVSMLANGLPSARAVAVGALHAELTRRSA